ncbi:MAG: hypothetical protein CR993_01920 [Rhodobacterales bacterium]|nr:MAG: hypothetical protein CR993_01920 [Rhodobacterales bacterium]
MLPRSGGCAHKIVIKHLWRPLKQEAVYPEEIADGFHARRVIGNRMTFHYTQRPLSALERRTPGEAYRHGREQKLAA